MSTIYDIKVKAANGELVSLQQYAGQPLLIVNTASKCGFTPQFEGLQKLYETYSDQGLVILGFPCDQFNNQEFDDLDETLQFCQVNYGVSFPMFAKIDVNGEQADPLFTYLKDQKRGLVSRKIEWNFVKFLVDQKGNVIKRYAATTNPSKIEKDVVSLLEK